MAKTTIEDYRRLLHNAKELGNREKEGVAYITLGNAYYKLCDFKQAIECHEQGLGIAKELGDKAREGAAYNNLGIAYHNLGDFKQAMEYHQKHLRIAEELGNREEEGDAYINLGNAYYRLCDFKQAIECHEQGLRIAKELGDKAREGLTYRNLGIAHRNLGDFKQAIEYHQKHLRIAKEQGLKGSEGNGYCSLGNAYRGLGDFKQAIKYYKKSLSIAKELGMKDQEGYAYGSLGSAYDGLGDFKQAIEYNKKMLSIAKELGEKDVEGSAYGNLGCAYSSLGDFKLAIEYHTKHLNIAQDLGNRLEEGRGYGNLGIAYHGLGDFKQAIEHHKKRLSIAKELGQRDKEGSAYCNLGIAYRCLGDFRKAVEYGKKDLRIAKELGERDREGNAHGNLGSAYLGLDDFQQAVECHQQCLSIAKELGQRHEEGLAYSGIGNAHCRLGDFDQAIEYHKKHLSIAIELGQKAGEGAAYGHLGGAYYMLGDNEKAIEYHKKCFRIAKELGQKHNEGVASFALGWDFESSGALHEALDYYRYSVKLCDDVRALLQLEDVLKISFRVACQQYYTALWEILVRLSRTNEALCVAEQGRAQALVDIMKVQYGSVLLESGLFEGKATISDRIISNDLSAQTVFVALADKTIHLWVACKERPVQLRQITVEENAVTFLESLRKSVFKENQITARVACEDRSLGELRNRLPPSQESLQETKSLHCKSNSLRIFHDCFIGPIADLLQGDELIIVPDGPLCLAPYAAFLDSESRYLSQSIRTRILPSLTSLQLIANSAEDYHRTSGVLLVGEPCLEKFTNLLGEPIFSPLPYAKKEVEMIGKMLNIIPLTGKEATKEEVLRRIGSVALVHIAAHGDMEAGEIALAPNPALTSNIRNEKDFMLKMADVQAVQLRARLVVLSCCHSARGRVTPEGVVGIGRAFLGAGARSVLVSLWAIDDEATMEFMKSFYKHLRDGNCTSVAVNRARKCLRESEKFSAVKYWAPFVLIGDDVTIDFGNKQQEHCEYYFFGPFACLVIDLYFKKHTSEKFASKGE